MREPVGDADSEGDTVELGDCVAPPEAHAHDADDDSDGETVLEVDRERVGELVKEGDDDAEIVGVGVK